MGSGFSKMKKQARLMQEQMGQAREKMETTLVEGSAGGGLVTVTMNGAKELKKIVIRPECVDPKDVEGLQDLILAAFQNGAEKLSEADGGAGGGFPFFK
jgi:DNA-binding YbaB/EbfC family protein